MKNLDAIFGLDQDRGVKWFENPDLLIMMRNGLIKAKKTLSNPINPEDFADYDSRMIAKDMNEVDKLKMRIADNDAHASPEQLYGAELGKIFEAIIFEQAEQSNWLGETASTIQASEFDDIINGIDSIVEFVDESTASHVALAIDAATGKKIDKKLHRIKTELDKTPELDEGELATIKYFHSDRIGFTGRKTNVPRAVVTADHKTVFEVMELWLKNDHKALAEHPLQIKILQEMRMQLQAFKTYSERIGKQHLGVYFEMPLRAIEEVIAKKGITQEQLETLQSDELFMLLSQQLEEQFK